MTTYEEALHSAEYFGRQRDFWWNPDYLALTAKRCDFSGVHLGLDVGCGVGHWGRALAPFLPPESMVVGLDREPKWVKEAGENAAKAGLEKRFSYVQGDASALPFEADRFDLVTCQTVLIHVADRIKVLREMLRVLKPGGRLLIVEPNNLGGAAADLARDLTTPVEHALDSIRFQLICERGKNALGLGFNSAGERIPGELASLGVSDLQIFLSDKTYSMIPPYEREAESAQIDQAVEWSTRDFWIWDKPESEKYFLAGGGTKEEFARHWESAMKGRTAFLEEAHDETYHSAGGGITYLILARKR